jgi:NAD(P)-dependent dehydrogenase (short-subunit alcohol dehydrogenase family)
MLDQTNLQAKRRRTRPSLAGMTSPTVLITGCSSGIGFATAQAFARGGATVFASARRPETLTSLTGEGVQTLALDVLEDDSMRAAVSEVEARCGAIDVLVNNAGYALQAPVEEANLDDVRRQFETNVFGLVRLTQLVLPAMRQQRSGRVINLSSMGGRFTFPGGGFYHATKHAVESLSDALRLELAPFGISVVVIEPGPVRTEFGTTAIGTLESPAAGGPGPYDDFMHRVAATYASTYAGRGHVFASSPERVASVIVSAAGARRPRARYVVGPVAHALVTSRRLLPDRAFDALIRAAFAAP